MSRSHPQIRAGFLTFIGLILYMLAQAAWSCLRGLWSVLTCLLPRSFARRSQLRRRAHRRLP